MSRGGLFRRFPVLGIRDFRLLLTDRLIAPASVGFSIVGVSFAVLKATGSAADLSYVLAAQIAPPWAYTVGLWLSHQGPEMTMFGLPVEHMTVILNSIGERIARGAPIEAGDRIDGICPCSLAIRPVHESWRMTSMFSVSDQYPRLRQAAIPADGLARPPGPLSG